MITVSTSVGTKAGYHHGDLRSALIQAGLQILEEGQDPAVLSLREAARRVGVSAMAPYRHFADKDALLAALATVGFDMLGDALRTADSANNSEEALAGQGVAYVQFACDHPAIFRLMFGAKSPMKTNSLATTGVAAFSVLAERVASMVPGANAKSHALANWALVHGLAMLAVDGQLGMFDASPIDLARQITRIAVERTRNA